MINALVLLIISYGELLFAPRFLFLLAWPVPVSSTAGFSAHGLLLSFANIIIYKTVR